MDKVWIAIRDDDKNHTGLILGVCATEELALNRVEDHYLYRTYGGYWLELADDNESDENKVRAKDKLGGDYYVKSFEVSTEREPPA